MALNLYLIERDPAEVGYDENDAMVIAAENTQDARLLANQACSDEGAMWTDATRAKTRQIGTATTRTKPGIVLRSHNAG